MHHYPFHPGDYMMATAHLEPLHDLCYRRCLDLYYDTEIPLSTDKRTLSKRLRVNEDVLSEVLSEFFEESEDGWRHRRCDKEIARYQAKSEKNKLAGSLGGKAKKTTSEANAKRTLSERKASASNQNQEPEPKPSKGKCTLDEAKAFAVEIEMPAGDGEACFHKWEGNGWKNGTSAVKDWKATMRSWKASGYLPSQKLPSFGIQPKKPKYTSCL